MTLFKKMLDKNPTKRPCVETIIFSDIFQLKAQQNHVTLPLILNKQKLQDKFSLGQLAGIDLTEKQKRLAGILFSNKPNKVKPEPRPSVRQSILNQNLNNKKDKEDSPEKRPQPKDGRAKVVVTNKLPWKNKDVGGLHQSKKEVVTNVSTRSHMTERGEAKKDKQYQTEAKVGERASFGSKRGGSGQQRKHAGEGDGTADKEGEKEGVVHRRTTIAGSRFGMSRPSIASNLTNRTKHNENSPQKKEQPSATLIGNKKRSLA